MNVEIIQSYTMRYYYSNNISYPRWGWGRREEINDFLWNKKKIISSIKKINDMNIQP